MGKYTMIAVATILGISTAYFIASRLDTDRFALKLFVMGIVGVSFSTSIQMFRERIFPPAD